MILNDIDKIDNLYFLLHANFIIVKDNVWCGVYDLHKHNIYRFDTIVFDVFNECEKKTVIELMDLFGGNYNEGILKYITYFLEIDIGVLVYNPKLFPKINFEYERPYEIVLLEKNIVNSVLDIQKLKENEKQHVFALLDAFIKQTKFQSIM